MKNLILIASAIILTACSSSPSAPSSDAPTPPATHSEKQMAAPATNKAGAVAKPFTPAKPMKCKFDTDCVIPDSCSSNKCKLTGNDCRFRSDCPSPRGTCINDKCEFR